MYNIKDLPGLEYQAMTVEVKNPLSRAMSFGTDLRSAEINKKTVVFISYIREERERAEKFVTELKNATSNLEPWMDTEILAGQDWEKEIKKAIKVSRYFIPLISSRAVEKNGFTRKEFEYALNVIKETQLRKKIIVIPIRLDDCKIPYSLLQRIQYVDLFPDWNQGFEKLLEAIKRGDNLVDGYQFEWKKRFNKIRNLGGRIRHPFRTSMTSDPSDSSSLLQELGSSMEIDKDSITNPFHIDSYTLHSFSFCSGSKGSHDGQFDNPTGIAIDS